ncbi:MAG: hypothetical protein HMLIMOIP_000247 [Candidatus Nitrosomirales archaeon]|jgi:hypothetical protein
MTTTGKQIRDMTAKEGTLVVDKFETSDKNIVGYFKQMQSEELKEKLESALKSSVPDPWTNLLHLEKKVKDSLHKSIWLTKTEIKIINSPEFQRLRHIRQTGPAYLLYPTAQHTRFDHSLGTMCVAQRMVDSINTNEPKTLSSRDIFLIRLDALLHDLVHLPFGHTLEDEGRLFLKKQWQSDVRQEIFFKPMAKIIKEQIVIAFKNYNREQEGKLEAEKAVEQIKRTLIAEEGPAIEELEGRNAEEVESESVEELEAPYIADIVGNTICADLLDYVERDLFFCGLSGGYDELIFFYMTVQDVPNYKGQMKKRLVIRLFKKQKTEFEIRPDVLTGLVDLLRTRYSIGERVYYHHTKREASAMIIKMVAAAMKAGIITEQGLCVHGDDSLLYSIHECKNDALTKYECKHLEIAKNLESCFSKRELYKPVYSLSIRTHENSIRINELINRWEKRYETEEKLCQLLDLKPGDILIYVPSKHMGSKQAKALVQLPPPYDAPHNIRTLHDLARKPVEDVKLRDNVDILKAELDALDHKHRVLWKLSVFVHPRIKEKEKRKELELYTICQEWFESRIQYALVNLIAHKHSFELDSEIIPEISEKVRQIVDASDIGIESTFSRYCSEIEKLLPKYKSAA